MIFVFGFGIYYMNRLIERGPEDVAIEPPKKWMPGRTLSAGHHVREASRKRAVRT
jgi:hypothetical protein